MAEGDLTNTRGMKTPSTASFGTGGSGGIILGRYRILGATGSGGFGTVLTCWDTRLQRRVAIKRMPLAVQGSPASNASTLEEALREARMTSLLTHPNIVVVHDFEVDERFAYLVMEYVDGISLLELLARVEGGTLTCDECAYLVRSLGQALTYAHENHVLHLDIKPSNIMFDHSGTVKLCDFGMATLASATGFGDARGGTVGYMAPEQIAGDLVDERSDVFSLAVVIWQALTGENPFAAPSAEESLALIQKGPRTPLSKLVPQTAGMAEEAITGALDPNPATRIASVADFAEEVIFGLGDPDAGASSIAHLMGQTPQEDEDEAVWEGERLPLGARYPWAFSIACRAATAIVCGLVCARILPYLLTSQTGLVIPAALCCAALAALWPPLATLAAGIICSLAFGVGRTGAAAVMVPTVLLAILAIWWMTSGRHARLSSIAALLPALAGCPIAGIAPSAFGLDTRAAGITCMGGALFEYLFASALECSFNPAATVESLAAVLQDPSTLAVCIGAGLCSISGAALARHSGSVLGQVAGQITSAALVIFLLCIVTRMKNGGIWASPNWAWVAIAVLLSVLFCIIAILRGPLQADEEDEGLS